MVSKQLLVNMSHAIPYASGTLMIPLQMYGIMSYSLAVYASNQMLRCPHHEMRSCFIGPQVSTFPSRTKRDLQTLMQVSPSRFSK